MRAFDLRTADQRIVLSKIDWIGLLLIVVLLGVAGMYLSMALRTDPFGDYSPLVDDAYIPLRYAQNAADGFGLVWNPGGPRVQGYSSQLHLLTLIVFEKLGLTALAWAPLFGALCAVVSMALTVVLLRQLNPRRQPENLVGAILLGLSPQFWFWSLAGLETTLFAVLVLASVLAYLGKMSGRLPAWCAGALFALCGLTRPEGALLFAFTLAFDAALAWREEPRKWRSTLGMLAGFAAIYLPVFVWQGLYFGDLLPNTYYAKTGAGWIQIRGGWNYLFASLADVFAYSLVPLLLVLVSLGKRPLERLYVAFALLSACILIVLEGGDHFGNARFLAPFLPLVFVLATLGLSELTRRLTRVRAALCLGVLILVALLAFRQSNALTIEPGWAELPKADSQALAFLDDWVAGFRVMGRTLREIATPDQSIAVVPIGAIGYFSGMQVIDMTGLTDPVIAHEPFDPDYVTSWRPGHDKGDGPYVLRQQPDFIQLVDRLTSQPFPGVDEFGEQYKSVMEIWNAPEFERLYEFYPVRVRGGWYYNLYRLKSNPG